MPDFDPRHIERPDPVLLRYYGLVSLVATLAILPLTALVLLPHYLKFRTMRYRFDDEGVSMSYGMLFRREIQLAYRRIQDIHVTRNLFQRWMGLATVALQTASGSSSAEMSIEGILEADALRDYLYARMRGARGEESDEAPDGRSDDGDGAPVRDDDVLSLLEEIRDGVRRLAEAHAGDDDGSASP